MIVRFIVVVAACAACEKPVYDDRLGVAGVPTEDGALAGRFGLVATCADLANVPIVGEHVGGGMTFSLVERSWDGAAYQQTNNVCRVDNFEVAGLASAIAKATARSIPPVPVSIAVDHASGAVSTERYFEMWAVRDLSPDDPMPSASDDARFFDMEDDGNPGATVSTSGLVNGELYFAQRKGLSLEGVVRGPDELLGLIEHKKEATMIAATDDLLLSESERAQHPDPLLSWWHEVRLAEDASCEDLEAAVEDGSVSMLRPF